MGGGGSSNVKPLTKEEMEKDTDNPFENSVSGVSAPSWKPDKVKQEKADIAAAKAKEEAAAKAATVSTTEVVPRSGSGKYTMTKKPGGGYKKVKTSTHRSSLRARARKK